MKRALKRFVPFVLVLGILASIVWYLFIYDREFTRDMLLQQARYHDTKGSSNLASLFYDWAYDYTGQDEDVAIELANQYKADGNFTKAEYTLTNAIADGGDADLYVALCKTFVEQDKLLDAVNMLDSISDSAIKAQLDAMRPSAPAADPAPGYYSQYIPVKITSSEGTVYYTTDGDYPSTSDTAYSEPIVLPGGETIIYALSVADNGLVSPLSILGYTVGGVIEEATFVDPSMEAALREQLGVGSEDVVMTNQLWEIKEFTVPADASVYDDLALLPYLEKLQIADKRFDSLGFLSSLSQLTELKLTDCRFPSTELSVVAALPNLQKLTLSDCGLSTIADLAGAQKLSYLDLSSNTLRNLEVLSPMTSLTEINLQHNAVTGLDALATLTNLATLDISHNSVKDLSVLSICQKLSKLNAGNNSIAALNGVESLTALTSLNVEHNQLTDVDLLGQCIGLKELDVSNNALPDVNSLSALTNLETLDLSYNQVVKLPTWPEGSALTTIDGSYNQIVSVYQLRHVENLTYVYMDYNRLTTLDDIAGCYHLVMVNAYGNDIEDVEALTAHNIIVNYDPTTDSE